MQTNILLIDDEIEYCKTLKNRFSFDGVQITFFHNLEEGIAELERENSKYKALILDAKCLRTKEQEAENFDFLPEALDELERVNRQAGRVFMPFAIITGCYDQKIFNLLTPKIDRQRGKVFEKFQEDEMLGHLLEEINKAEDTKIEIQYKDVFEVFDNLLQSDIKFDYRRELLKILKNMENPSEHVSVLRAIRVMQEKIYKVLNNDKGIFSTDFRPKKYPPSFSDKNWYLSGSEDNWIPTTTVYQTSAIKYLAKAVYVISSDFGHHDLPTRPIEVPVKYWQMPSTYAVKSLVFGLLEQLLWFKVLMTEEQK